MTFYFLCVLAASALRAADKFSLARTDSKPPTLAMFTWLAGTWSFEKDGRVITEHWLAPTANMMIGVSQTVANGKTIDYEFVLIRQEATGEIFYVAKPSGQPEASFKVVRATEKEAIFENPAHDFPQRISYTLQPEGGLLAVIEGAKGSKARRTEFHYRRVKR